MHESITSERVQALAEDQMFGTANPGVCTECGEEQDDCEPDARQYVCESCGAHAVYGAEELMFMIA